MAEIDTVSGKAGVRDTQAVRPSGTVTFEELPEADYEIALSGVQVNCLPKDSSSQRGSVPEDPTEASFTLTWRRRCSTASSPFCYWASRPASKWSRPASLRSHSALMCDRQGHDDLR